MTDPRIEAAARIIERMYIDEPHKSWADIARAGIDAFLAAAEVATPAMLHAAFGTADEDNQWRWQAALAHLRKEIAG